MHFYKCTQQQQQINNQTSLKKIPLKQTGRKLKGNDIEEIT